MRSHRGATRPELPAEAARTADTDRARTQRRPADLRSPASPRPSCRRTQTIGWGVVALGSNIEGRPRDDPAALAAAVLDEEARRHEAQTASAEPPVIADDLLPGVGTGDVPMG